MNDHLLLHINKFARHYSSSHAKGFVPNVRVRIVSNHLTRLLFWYNKLIISICEEICLPLLGELERCFIWESHVLKYWVFRWRIDSQGDANENSCITYHMRVRSYWWAFLTSYVFKHELMILSTLVLWSGKTVAGCFHWADPCPILFYKISFYM